MRLKVIIFFILATLCVSAAKLPLKHLDTVNHLSSNKINNTLKDSDGFIWIGTSSGLYRYDGYTFKNYEPTAPDELATFDNCIEEIQEDGFGRLWIYSGLKYSVYDPITDRLSTNIEPIFKKSNLSAPPSLLHIDSSSNIWLYYHGNGLYKLDRDFGNAHRVADPDYASDEITDIVDTPLGIVTINNRGILKIIDRESLKVTHTDNYISTETTDNNTFVFTFVYDRNGLGWIYNTERLWLYNLKTGKWLNEKLPQNDRRFVKSLAQDNAGRLWIGRDHYGLEEIVNDGNKFSFRRITTDTQSNSLNTITSLYEDSEGIFWIGTYKKGLYYHHPTSRKFDLHTFPDVNCILQSADNIHVWIGTDAAEVIRWNPTTDARQHIDNGSLDGAVTSMLELPDGRLFIGSFSRGLRMYRNGRIETVKTNSLIDNAYCWSLNKYDNDNILIGSLGSGLFIYNHKTGEISHFTEKSGLSSNYIVSTAIDTDKTFFVGTASGVLQFTPSTSSFAPIPELNDIKINDIMIDSRGLLWIASARGLKLYDPQRKRLTPLIPDRHTTTSNLILGIKEDLNGDVWASEGGSLICFSVKFNDRNGDISYTSHRYNASDGLQESDFNQRSFARLSSGKILVGGLYGINSFFPDKILFNRNLPKVMFSNIYAGQQEVRPGDEIKGHILLKSSPNHGGELELWHSNSSFTVHFATDNYLLPEKTTYHYMLDGLDKEWMVTPPNSNRASYTNLNPGRYRLLVKAVNGDGYESDETAEMTIIVHPPFWLTPWAKAFYILLGLAAIYLTYRLIRRQERRRFNEKRKQDALQKQEEVNQLKFKFYTNVSHELRTPLTLIVSPLESMIKETTDERQLRRLNIMRTNALRLLTLVNQLLDFRKNEVTGLTLNLSEGEIVGFVRNVCHAFAEMSERKNINLKFVHECQELNMMFDEDKLSKAITNLLANAFKFTPEGGNVAVSLSATSSELIIQVADTGIGISDADKTRIFDRFFQTGNTPTDRDLTGNGIGLSMVNEYVKLHNGVISVADNTEKGSIFTIRIPIVKATSDSKSTEVICETVASSESEPHHDSNDVATNQPTVAETISDASHTPTPDKADKPTALIVDDSRDMLDFLRDGLSSEFHIITAADGSAALNILSTIRPAIILTDLMMPGMSGIELCQHIKSDSELSSIPIIILTAKHDTEAKVQGLTIGADDYITKPFNIDLLLLKMQKLVSLTRKTGRKLIDPEPDSIKITPLDEKMVEKAVKFVVTNMKRPDLSVEELSSHLGMSRVNLYKKLKATTGKTPIEFIRLIRMKRGAQLLRESQLNISEIAFQIGYSQPKNFSKYFKEEFGVLPSVYQNKEHKATNYPV